MYNTKPGLDHFCSIYYIPILPRAVPLSITYMFLFLQHKYLCWGESRSGCLERSRGRTTVEHHTLQQYRRQGRTSQCNSTAGRMVNSRLVSLFKSIVNLIPNGAKKPSIGLSVVFSWLWTDTNLHHAIYYQQGFRWFLSCTIFLSLTSCACSVLFDGASTAHITSTYISFQFWELLLLLKKVFTVLPIIHSYSFTAIFIATLPCEHKVIFLVARDIHSHLCPIRILIFLILICILDWPKIGWLCSRIPLTMKLLHTLPLWFVCGVSPSYVHI